MLDLSAQTVGVGFLLHCAFPAFLSDIVFVFVRRNRGIDSIQVNFELIQGSGGEMSYLNPA